MKKPAYLHGLYEKNSTNRNFGVAKYREILYNRRKGGMPVFDVMNYVHDHIREKLSLTEIAALFGYSKWHFCKKFHDFAGMTFLEYVRHHRIQLAAIDILRGDTVTDVAFRYSYDTVGGFNKAFLTHYGCLPRKYRERAEECRLYYERRRMSMYPLTDRCLILRDEAMNRKEALLEYCVQRNVYFSLGRAAAMEAGKSRTEAIADGILRIAESMTPVMIPGELVVGFNYGDGTYGEYVIPNNDPVGRELMDKNHISEADREAFWGLNPVYYGETDEIRASLTTEEIWALQEWAGIGRCICANHTVLGYEKVLKLGFDGILREIEGYEAVNGESSHYRAMKTLCRAGFALGEKYAAEAERRAETEEDASLRADYAAVAAACRQVPRYPARSFLEAVQSLWFAHILNTWEDRINANSIGRLDQILYPYYKADVDKGILTREQAFEIICCLWIKLYRDYDVQQSCVGGTNPDGTSAVNDLSYLMLDATEQLDFIRCLSVRYGAATEKKFLRRALEVVGHVQKGVPFFFNDDIMVKALTEQGISREDAFGYTQIGCVETVIPGKSNPHAVTGETNLLKALEYVLGNGHSLCFPDFKTGAETGELSELDTYDKLYTAVLTQVERILDLTCSQVKKCRDACIAPKPYKSMLTGGCIERGLDFNDAGATYDYYQIMLGGVPNLADSLAVIKKFVYDDGTYTLPELKAILVADFPDERVRQSFIRKAPKFGNDLDEVDLIAADIIDKACDMLERMTETYGLSFHAQPFTFLWMIDHGRTSAASPDGRRMGESIAYSVSPMQGRDFNGLTAVFNSIAKLPAHRTAGTTSAIVEADPKLFTDENLDIITDILVAASKKGLCNVQFNITDAETLMEAQKHPEKYANLAVRVSGFSQKFNLLTPELQNHIIGRTKHACL